MIDKINEAIADQKPIRIRYAGGSQPNTEREVLPVKIENGKLIAISLINREMKTFELSKTTLIEESLAPDPNNQYIVHEVEEYKDLNEIYTLKKGFFESLGWTVILKDNHLGLYKSYKNGKIQKHPTVSIYYEEMTSESVFNGTEFVQSSPVRKSKPWSVVGKKNLSYGYLSTAQITFFEWANEMANK